MDSFYSKNSLNNINSINSFYSKLKIFRFKPKTHHLHNYKDIYKLAKINKQS